MRVITLTWERTTGELIVDNFSNITRGDVLDVRLFLTDSGSKFLLPEEVNIEAVAKQNPASAALIKILSFNRPTDSLQPYTATLDLRSANLADAFADEVEGDIPRLDLRFELQASDGPTSSERVLLQVHNEYVRDADPIGELPIEESPSDWLSARAVRHDVEQALSAGAKAQALSNLGITAGGKVDVQIFDVAGTHEWTKPAGAKLVEVFIDGGGGAGAAGSSVLEGYVYVGGGGGSPAGHVELRMLADLLPTAVAVEVGAGGLGGTLASIDGGDGAASSFYGISAVGGKGALGRQGGVAQADALWIGGVTQPSNRSTLAGGNGAVPGGAGGESAAAAQKAIRLPTGGGGGGSAGDGESMVFVGGRGGNMGTGTPAPVLGGQGGTAASIHGEDGRIDPVSGLTTGAGGGCSGAPVGAILGGNGGNGAVPGGAGGGGGALGGLGGNGGVGRVVVMTYC